MIDIKLTYLSYYTSFETANIYIIKDIRKIYCYVTHIFSIENFQ